MIVNRFIYPFFFSAIWLLIGIVIGMMCTGCSVTLQNLDTRGQNSDLIDDEMTANPNIKLPSIPILP